MKAGWTSVRVGDVIVENPKSKLKVRDSISNGEYPFFTSGVSINSFDDFLCDGDNIFIATGGKACFQYYEGKAAYSTDCYAITTRPGLVPKFLFYFFNSISEDIEANMFEGAALRHLQKNKFREILTPFPPIKEQQRIVAILDEAFIGIASACASVAQNIQNANNLYVAALETSFRESVNCEMVEFGSIIETLTDYHANGSYEVLRDNVELKDSEDFAWMVRSTDFENGFQNKMRYITESAYQFLKKSQIFGGELIMSKIGNAGKVYLMPAITRPCSLAMNLFLIRLNDDKASNSYIYRFLKSDCGEKQIHSKLKGAATQTITKESVRSLLIPLLPRRLQDIFVISIDKIEAEAQSLKALYQRKLALMEELKQSLLHQAFSGQL